MKIYTPQKSKADINWIDGAELALTLEEADAVLLTGGADVQPSLYGHPRHSTTYCDPHRDEEDFKAIDYALENNKPVFGICRGSQVISVYCGGEMIQDVKNHTGCNHGVYLPHLNTSIVMPSTHHQMVHPYKAREKGWDVTVVGMSTVARSNKYSMGDGTDNWDNLPTIEIFGHSERIEPEITEYRQGNKRLMGWQFHPEWSDNKEGLAVLNQLIKEFMANTSSKSCFKVLNPVEV